jgi:hypothetical protein
VSAPARPPSQIDERGDHRSVGSLDDLGRRSRLLSQGAHLVDDLLDAIRRPHGLPILLQHARFDHPALPLSDQLHDLPVQSVDLRANILDQKFSHAATVPT